jgi:hypothetical protein
MEKVGGSEYHAKNDENMGEGRKLRGKEETGKICFMAVGGEGRPCQTALLNPKPHHFRC